MSDELGKAAAEITAGFDARRNAVLLGRVAYHVADMVQEYRTPELENLRDRLRREGLQIPLIGCEGFTRHGEECAFLKYHTGDCA